MPPPNECAADRLFGAILIAYEEIGDSALLSSARDSCVNSGRPGKAILQVGNSTVYARR